MLIIICTFAMIFVPCSVLSISLDFFGLRILGIKDKECAPTEQNLKR